MVRSGVAPSFPRSPRYVGRMPELPEVEAVCRKLRESVVGAQIRAVDARRCAAESVAVLAPGKRIKAVERRAKHILIRLSQGHTLHVHLRMTGNLYAIPDVRLHAANARVVFELTGKAGMIYADPRALGRLEIVDTATLDAAMAELGPEPLGAEFTADRLAAMARQSKQPAKLFLMDQSKVAGLGNIYVAEVLFRARIDPRKPLARLKRPRLDQLHGEIVSMMEDAIQSADKAYAGPGEFSEAEEFPLAVYGREGEACGVCLQKIRRIAQGGRSTYYCAYCQK
jgi:formamidopyrimidine-DNA glycosylase